MRGLLCAALVIVGLTSSPALAWEFSISPICTVTDRGSDTGLKLTFDGELYALHLSHIEGWQNAEVFAIRFAPNGPFIQTTWHQIDGQTLSVSDAGFGNVLKGLQDNQVAQVLLGKTFRDIDLSGAYTPVENFKNCKPGAALS
mgnify:FL=1